MNYLSPAEQKALASLTPGQVAESLSDQGWDILEQKRLSFSNDGRHFYVKSFGGPRLQTLTVQVLDGEIVEPYHVAVDLAAAEKISLFESITLLCGEAPWATPRHE